MVWSTGTSSRLKWGAEWGLISGGVFALMALVVLALKGFPDIGMPVAWFLVLYLLAGLVGGVLVGLTRPLMTTPTRTSMLGVVIALPIIAVLAPSALGPYPAWGGEEWGAVVLSSVVLGWFGARNWWTIFLADGSDANPGEASAPPAPGRGRHRRR